MFTEKFYDVLNYEGTVSITSWETLTHMLHARGTPT